MNIAQMSIKRPVFIGALVIFMLAIGMLSYIRTPVDQYPDVTLPYLMTTVVYPGAGPEEVSSLVGKPLEDELRTIAGVKNVTAINSEGSCFMLVQFHLETDPNYAEQQVRAKVGLAKTRMPREVKEPVIQRYDVSDQPVLTLSLTGTGDIHELYDYADRSLRPQFEQVSKVSRVVLYGGAKREIQVLLSRAKLADYEISASDVAQALQTGGYNIPIGKWKQQSDPTRDQSYRSLGEFDSVDKIRRSVVKYFGNDYPPRIGDLGTVVDGHEDETSRSFVNGKRAIVIDIYKQSGANTVDVADRLLKRFKETASLVAGEKSGAQLSLIRNNAQPIRENLQDVGVSIFLGILLTVLVVFLFLGNMRSTVITGIAIPNSLIGAFILVAAVGFSVNMLTLLALSLAVGLLIDDAIVVRENIFRHMSMGKTPAVAALEGTTEVMLAVVATTLAVLSVFGPIAFVGGITGKFLREFGLTVCFVMAISLFDAVAVGPMLSAYFGGIRESNAGIVRFFTRLVRPVVNGSEYVQQRLEDIYEATARRVIAAPGKVILAGILLVAISMIPLRFIPKTFLPSGNNTQFMVSLEYPPGTTLDAIDASSRRVDEKIRTMNEIESVTLIAGARAMDIGQAKMYVILKPGSERKTSSDECKQKIRTICASFTNISIKVSAYESLFGGTRPFMMKLVSHDRVALTSSGDKIFDAVKHNPAFSDPDTDFRKGNPEMRIVYDEEQAKKLGVSTYRAGSDLRAQLDGVTPVKYREQGEEWDVRVRLQESDRNLEGAFSNILVPNLGGRLVPLSQVAHLENAEGFMTIRRINGQYAYTISADVASGYGIGDMMSWVEKEMKEKHLLADGVHYMYLGQGEQFQEMATNMLLAAALAVLFIYLVLASLYNSFTMPLALLLPLPLGVSGAFLALWMARESLNIFSIIATIMLLGIAAKNSILLIDYTNHLIASGKGFAEAVVEAGKTRLRPILMTSMAMLAGTLPVAIGINEASRQRSSMGWVIIGGVISSTLLSLVIVPATLAFFNRRKKG